MNNEVVIFTDKELTPDEALRRIRSHNLGDVSHNTKVCLNRLADEHRKLQQKLAAAEKAIRGFGVAHDKLIALPELQMSNYDEEQVQQLNDGVCEICCEMDTTRNEYSHALTDIEFPVAGESHAD